MCFFVIGLFFFQTNCSPERPLSFNQDIAPIIFENCSPCHRDEGIGPMTFSNYKEVAEYSEMIADVTRTQYMPPWSADTEYTSFVQQRSLEESQIQLIQRWVKQGAPEGDADLCCKVSDYENKNDMEQPDKIVCMETAFQIKGNNKDTYRTFVLPVELSEERFVSAVELVPGNPKLLHHAWVFLDTTGVFLEYDSLDEEQGIDSFKGMKGKLAGMLSGYMPGYTSETRFPKGTGKKIFLKTFLILNVHYAPSPIDASDQTCVHLYFSEKKPQRQILAQVIKERSITNGEFVIPANKVSYFHMEKEIEEAISVVSIYPHMHFRGKTFKAYAETSEGENIPLIKIDDWDFNWQSAHTFPHLLKIPAGAKIHVEATYDNRADNPFNPVLPPVDAVRGNSSYDEMMCFGLEYLKYQQGDEQIKYTD